MKTLDVRGLVLKEYETGEADKRLLLLCKEHGRIMAYARGARKPRSKFMAAAQLFTYSDFVLAAGRGFFSVSQADVIESFYNLRTDYDRLATAHLITDVCEKTVLENTNCDGLLRLVLKCLMNLTKDKFPHKHIIAVFFMKFFEFYGIRPKIGNGEYWNSEGICEKPTNTDTIKISPAAAAACSFILNSELAQAFSFEATENILDELIKMSRLVWRGHFDAELKFI